MNSMGENKLPPPASDQFQKYCENTNFDYVSSESQNQINSANRKEESKEENQESFGDQNHSEFKMRQAYNNFVKNEQYLRKDSGQPSSGFPTDEKNYRSQADSNSEDNIMSAVKHLKDLTQAPELLDASVDDEPYEGNTTSVCDQQSELNVPVKFQENSTNMFDEMENGQIARSIGSLLYQDHKNRLQRQKTIQENLEKEMKRKMNESKVNTKSQKMYIKKIEKDIKEVIDFVDDQNTGLITFNGLGYILFFLDVFKIQYNEHYLNKLSQKAGKNFNKEMMNEQCLNNYSVISFVTLKNEERRIQEENFHHKLWNILNPSENDYIEREILYEYLKLMFDPYTPLDRLIPIINDFIDIINKAKEMHDRLDSQREEDRAPTMKAIKPNEELKSDERSQENHTNSQAMSQETELPLPQRIQDILDQFKYLYDYKGGNRKIKIPSYKKQKAFYEVYKECTFKPALNKKSLVMNQKKKEEPEVAKKDIVGSIKKTKTPTAKEKVQEEPTPFHNPLAAVAGKIVPKSLVSKLKSSDSSRIKENSSNQNEIHNRLYELHNLDKMKREKNEAIRQENIRREESK